MDRLDIILPIVAKSAADGRRIIHGVASDGTFDLQQEITDVPGLKGSLPYLKQWGKFNDDHKPHYLGEVLEADIVAKGELVRRGVLDGSRVTPEQMDEPALYVRGELYKGDGRADHYWHILKNNGRLGFSIQGQVLEQSRAFKDGKPVTINKKCFINQIAITPQPVNPNTIAMMAKGWAIAKSRLGAKMLKSLRKALETGGVGIVPEGNVPGLSGLRQQSLDGAKKKRKKRIKEAIQMSKSAETRLQELRLIRLTSPTSIVKAWNMANDPTLAAEVPIEDMGQIKRQIHQAAKSHGLDYAIRSDREGLSSLLKSCSEAEIATLEWLSDLTSEEFESVLDTHDAALAKALESGTLQKSRKDDEESDEEETDDQESSEESDEEESADDSEGGEESEDEDESEEEEEDKGERKPSKPPFPKEKSFADRMHEGGDEIEEALDASEALSHMTSCISKSFEEVHEALGDLESQLSDKLAKSIASKVVSKSLSAIAEGVGEAVGKALAPYMAELGEVKKSLDELGKRPAPAGAYRVMDRPGAGGSADGRPSRELVKSLVTEAAMREMASMDEVAMADLNPDQIPTARVIELQTKLGVGGR